jgi:DHA2 family methylenomycin A resistance protein-like MFS transporter
VGEEDRVDQPCSGRGRPGEDLQLLAAFYGVVFVQSLYFQQQRGQSALITGLLFLPMTGMVATLNPIVARVMQRRGLLPTTIAGIVVMAAGLGALCLLPAAGAPVWLASLLMVPVGVGGSFTVPPLTALVMGQIPAERAGTASGVLNTARQMGGSLGVAVFGAVIATQASFISGLRLDFGITALLLILAAGAAIRLRPSERTNTKLAQTERTPCNT